MFCFVLLILLFVLIIFLVRKIQGFEVKVDNNKKEETKEQGCREDWKEKRKRNCKKEEKN